MHSLRFHVTESCLVELQRNKKDKMRQRNGNLRWMGYHVCIIFYSTSKLFVMHYQATTDETKYNDDQNYHLLNLNISIENKILLQRTCALLYFDNCYMFKQHMQVTLKKFIPEAIFSISSTRAPYCSSQLYFSL